MVTCILYLAWCCSLFSNRKHRFSTVTDVHGRTFGVWTLLTCTLCFLCAFNLENKPLYIATFLSFIYAFGHFLSEYLIYQTMALTNLTTVGIFAGIWESWYVILLVLPHYYSFTVLSICMHLHYICLFCSNKFFFGTHDIPVTLGPILLRN